MKTAILKRVGRACEQAQSVLRSRGVIVMAATLLAAAKLMAMPSVTTLTQIPYFSYPYYYGYTDGNTLYAQFHTPIGLAIDSSGDYLYVADRDNNAIRELDLEGGQTITFATNSINKPVGVAVDSSDNVFVLNRGNGTNGMVLEFDWYGDLIATNATSLTNAAGIALDPSDNIYVTVRSNNLICIAGVNQTTIATITNAGTSLQGIVVKHNGLIAACDSGNNGIWLIDPTTGIATAFAGFNGAGDNFLIGTYEFPYITGVPKAAAKFNQPYGVAEVGDGGLIVTDSGNNRVKIVNSAGTVTNLYGVNSNLWYGPLNPSADVFPGWWDGTVIVPDEVGDVEARLPLGVAFAPNGAVYVTEDYYHVIREIEPGTANLPLPPPPPPQVAEPMIGWVTFPSPNYVSVLNTDPSWSYVFNNDVLIAIEGTNGSQTFYTFGPTTGGYIPDPSPTNGTTPPYYTDGLSIGSVLPLFPNDISPYGDLTIKAIGTKNDGSEPSGIAQARFQFITANPTITGNNAAQFTITDATTNSVFYYTIDGSNPTPTNATAVGPVANVANGVTLSLNTSGTNLTFKICAYRNNYQPSAVITVVFSATNFVPNSISFGFSSGEASSDFVASPGQFFYAPVTLSVLANQLIYSLQFNLTVTNLAPAPPVFPMFGFQSMLLKPIPGTAPPAYEVIPPAMFLSEVTNIVVVTNVVGTNVVVTTNYVLNPLVNPPPLNQIIYPFIDNPSAPFLSLEFTNDGANLLGVGWLERAGQKNLYDTTEQDLIQYSMAHDTMFNQSGGEVILGGYAFLVPSNAAPGQTYRIQIGRPSATADGIGAPGYDVFINSPTNGSLTNGAINSIKNVTVGQRKYIAGDSAPFRWFNAGDFGDSNLDNADVMQVFQSAIYNMDNPPAGSDFFDAMDSCGATYVDLGHGYLELNTQVTDPNALNALFNGNDSTINQIAFGDGVLDVCDVYVTFRRSLDTNNLVWFRRFWTNGVRVAEIVSPSAAVVPAPAGVQQAVQSSTSTSITNWPKVNFSTGDYLATPGQVLQVPITAQVFGSYPLRVLMLNLNVIPLDGSPPLTTPVQFTAGVLGSPTFTSTAGNSSYAATWLNSAVSGFTNSAVVGYLTVTVPTNATSLSAYAIHFDHASASPNGLASFPKQTLTGLITLSSRTNSSYGDGIPDSWRLRYFLTISNILSQATADPDGDGMNNWQEYLAGTDPTDPKSYFKNIGTDPAAAQQSQDCVISWPSVSGKHYVIERSPSLTSPNWTSISTNLGNGTIMEYHDVSGGGLRFYRVRVQ